MLKRAWWAKSPSAKWVGQEKPEEQDGSKAAWALDRRTDPLLGRTLTHWPEASQSGGPQTCNNTPQLLKEHQALNGKAIRTRFPPEPNGYLHLGHAKSMNMNFSLAFERLEGAGVSCKRETVFRYDDTNPEAETKEFIACDLRVPYGAFIGCDSCPSHDAGGRFFFAEEAIRCSAQVARDGRAVDGLVS